MVNFEIAEENVEFYVATMALGLLQSIKNRTIPAEIDIWSLGRPLFWDRLKKNKMVSSELLTEVTHYIQYLTKQKSDRYERINSLS